MDDATNGENKACTLKAFDNSFRWLFFSLPFKWQMMRLFLVTHMEMGDKSLLLLIP